MSLARGLGRIARGLDLAAYFLREMILSNLRIAWDAVTPTHHMRPGILAVPLAASTDLEIWLLATLITLTPGSLSLAVSTDRATLFVHAMYVRDPERIRREIKEGLERRLLAVLR